MGTKEDYFEKAKAELDNLIEAGVVMCGNAFSQVLLFKGEPEATSDGLLTGQDGVALRSALGALGYAPEDWAGLSALNTQGEPLSTETLRLALTTIDPATIIALDEPAAAALREVYAQELVEFEDLAQATLQPGYVVNVLGVRILALGGFEASLSDKRAKQQMWAYLKQLPPLAEPY